MKKTAQTLLTAAIFATALGSAVPSQFRQPVQALEDPIVEVENNLVDIYGPPSMFTEKPEETTATERTKKTKTTMVTTTTAIETTTSVLYGPPWVFYGEGDVNRDGVSDARDLTIMKQIILNGNEIAENYPNDPRGNSILPLADVDHDGGVTEEDVHMFMTEVLGVPYKKQPAVTTTAPETTELFETTTSSSSPVHWMTGDPQNTTVTRRTMHTRETRETEVLITDLLPFTDTAIVALYGPPRTGDWDDFKWSAFEDLQPDVKQTAASPQSQTTKTETVDEANRNKEK